MKLASKFYLQIATTFVFFILAFNSTSFGVPKGTEAPWNKLNANELGQVNPFNGSLNFTIPLMTVQGRGDVQVPMFLRLGKRWKKYVYTFASQNSAPYSYIVKCDYYDQSNSVDINRCVDASGLQVPSIDPNPTKILVFPNLDNELDPGYGPGLVVGKSITAGGLWCNYPVSPGTQQSGYYRPRAARFSISFVSNDGSQHELVDKNTLGKFREITSGLCNEYPAGQDFSRGKEFISNDGSATKFISDSDIPLGHDYLKADYGIENVTNVSGFLYTADGSQYRIDNSLISWIKDRNGNKTAFSYYTGTNYPAGKLQSTTDSMGRTIEIEYDYSDIEPYGICDRIKFKGINGEDKVIRISKKNLINSLREGESLKTKYEMFPATCNSASGCDNNTPFNPAVVSKLWLPDGKSYKFLYNSFVELARVEFPTGSAIEYDYNYGTQKETNYEPYPLSRRVTEKRLYSNLTQASLQNKTTFSRVINIYNNSINNHTITTTNVVDANNNLLTKKVSYFHGDPKFGYTAEDSTFPYGLPNWKEGKEYQTEIYSSDGVTLVRKELNQWQNKVAPWFTDQDKAPGFDTVQIKRISILVENGSAIATLNTTEYDTVGSTDPDFFSHLNIKRSKAYNYKLLNLNIAQTGTIDTIAGLFSENDLVSVLETDYLYDSGYKNRHILGLSFETRIMNPANPTQFLQKSQIVYDEQSQYYSMADFGSTVGYEVPTGTYAHLRGNVTTLRTWFAEENRWIETHTQYDNFGNGRKKWDSTGDPLRFVETEYSSQYNYTYPTKIILPGSDPTGIHGTSENSSISTTYDFWTGLPLTTTDANEQVTTFEYDNLLRPKKIIPPDGASITEKEYGDTPGNLYVKVRQQIDVQNWAETTTFIDNLGRAYKTQTKDSQADIFSEVEYDSFGRVARTSNPYRQGEQKFWSKPRYDNVGRVVETFAPAPDGQIGASTGTVEFGISTVPNFVGTYITAIDASGRKSRSISNIYGIARIDEATDIGGTVESDLGTIENPNQPTFYTYNIKGELIKITQGNPVQVGQPVQYRHFMYDSFGRLIRVRQPEQTPNPHLATSGNPENNQWTAGYTYDIPGNIVRMTDAKGINVINEYDKDGRLTSRCYTQPNIQVTKTKCADFSSSEVNLDTPQADYYYDGKGLPQVPLFSRGALTKVTNSISEDYYTAFDNHGRVLASRQVTDEQNFDFTYKYNLSGGLIEQTYPSGRVVKTFLDLNGGLSTVSTKTNNGLMKTVATNFDYDASGAVKKMMLGNGLWETAQFNERFQLTQIGLGNTPTSNNIFKTDYEYGELNADGTSVNTSKNTGSIAKLTTTIPNLIYSQTYKYDALYRLTEAKEKATNGIENWKQTFGYDRFGNRTHFYQKVGETVLQLTSVNHPTIDPTTNRFTTGQGYEYDYNGNLIKDAEGREFKFNGDHKQIEVKPADNPNAPAIGRYYYDAGGNRVKKVTSSETTIFVYDGGGALVAEYSSQTQPTQYDTTSYLTTDHLSSPRVITDRQGNVISRRDFMPFGEEIEAGVGGRTEAQKYSLVGADTIRQRFTGYEKDAESNLDFAQARMYQNKHGRFTAVDPLLASANLGDPQTFNRYVYVSNDPINSTDPSGLCLTNGVENNKPCNNYSGTVYTDGKGLFADHKCPGCNVYNGSQRISAYGIDYLVTGDGWVQLSPEETVQSEGANDPLVEAGGGGVSDSVSLPGGTPGTTNDPLKAGDGGGSGDEFLPPIEQGENPLDEPLDRTQIVLNTIGQVPGFGEPFDLLSGGIDLIRGDVAGVGLTLLSAIPILGNGAGAAKIAKNLKKLNLPKGGVYTLTDEITGEVVRTGRAKNLVTRKAAHNRNPDLKDYRFDVAHRTDNYAEQRGLEHFLYKQYPNAKHNKIAAISKKNKNRDKYIRAARRFLKNMD